MVADCGILEDDRLELKDSIAARSPFERGTQQLHVGHDLGDDVDQRPEAAAKQDDPEPVGIRPPADEMENRHGLQDESPGVEETDEPHARPRTIARAFRRNC